MGRVTWAFNIMTLIGKSDSDIVNHMLCVLIIKLFFFFDTELLSIEANRDTQFDYFTVNSSAFLTRFLMSDCIFF